MKIGIEGTGKAIIILAGSFGTTNIAIEENTADGTRLISIDLDRPTALAAARAIEEIAKRK